MELSPLPNNCGIFSSTDVHEEQSLQIYGNPATDFLYVESDDAKDIQINLFDELGRLCLSTKITTGRNQIDISELPSGLYFLNYLSTNMRVVKI